MATNFTTDLPEEFADFQINPEEMGADAARAASKDTGGFGRRYVYLDMLLDGSAAGKAKGEDRVFLRYLTDYESRPEAGVLGWPTFMTHAAVKTKPKPASWEKDRKWPERMPAICRRDPRLKAKFNDSCWIDENRENDYKAGKPHPAPPRTYALAVLRQAVYGDGTDAQGGSRKKGKIIGFDDVMVEVPVIDDEGNLVKSGEGDDAEVVTETVPQYVVVRQAFKNYFQPLDTMARTYGTALDRDYLVVRDGDDKDTIYTHQPMDPIVLDLDGEQIAYDMSDQAVREDFYPDAPNLLRIILEQAGTEYYNRWFIPQPGDDEAKGSTKKDASASAPAGAATAEPDETAVVSMRDRLKQRRSTPASS